MKNAIKPSEQENVLFIAWQLLGALESKTDPKKDILDKNLVTSSYNLLNRIGYTTARPQWERNESNAKIRDAALGPRPLDA